MLLYPHLQTASIKIICLHYTEENLNVNYAPRSGYSEVTHEIYKQKLKKYSIFE